MGTPIDLKPESALAQFKSQTNTYRYIYTFIHITISARRFDRASLRSMRKTHRMACYRRSPQPKRETNHSFAVEETSSDKDSYSLDIHTSAGALLPVRLQDVPIL